MCYFQKNREGAGSPGPFLESATAFFAMLLLSCFAGVFRLVTDIHSHSPNSISSYRLLYFISSSLREFSGS